MLNWYCGWSMILAAFLTGALLGLYFYREDFLGGYTSFRRRIVRLGHISLAALGSMNVLYGLSTAAAQPSPAVRLASLSFIVGGVTMPAVCFLTAWRAGFRYCFFIPVSALSVAVVQTLWIGLP